MVKINQDTGKIEISFVKEVAELWKNYGMHEKLPTLVDDELLNECSIVEKKFFNHDSFMLILRPKNFIITSLGHHYDFKQSIDDKEVIRSYTPVPSKYFSCETDNMNEQDLYFSIKTYPNGIMSTYLSQINVNDKIIISREHGSFELRKLKDHCKIAIFAAGSGITPFCSLIDHLLRRSTNKV
jgi:ferredoxin-NADP reductase